MDLFLKGKRAAITGASKGIGRATARLLAEEGCDLVLISRDAASLDTIASEIRANANVDVAVVPADLARHDEVVRAAAAVGRIDILVNNAGAIPAGDLQTIDDARWREAWDLKVFGYIGVSRALYPNLCESRGTIVNVIGAGGEMFDPNYIAGAAGNAALMAFTRALGKGGVKDFVRVVGINPGPVSTGRIETLLRARAQRDFGDPERWQEFYASMPFGRPATPEEIANAVAFFASSRSGYTSGTILTIDGAPS